jgi:Flp pilus assembly protein TadD
LYPTELRLRFELGAALFKRQDYSTAIPELMKAQNSPHCRWSAMKLLADSFDARGMADLAARMREQLSKESGDDDSAGSAPVPVPTRPITPLDSSRAKRRPNENDRAA